MKTSKQSELPSYSAAVTHRQLSLLQKRQRSRGILLLVVASLCLLTLRLCGLCAAVEDAPARPSGAPLREKPTVPGPAPQKRLKGKGSHVRFLPHSQPFDAPIPGWNHAPEPLSADLAFLAGNYSDITARLQTLDTGRSLSIPQKHFSLNQPPPAIYNYNPDSALAMAKQDSKYFYECGADAKRDLRFVPRSECTIDNTVEKPEDYVAPAVVHDLDVVHEALTSLLRAWATFSEQHGITWWISHGELLGWYWNGRLMPWDADLDLQMSTYQLIQLVAFNQTLIEGRFLIDVNPSILYRTPQEMNTIDARIVDTKTGYLADITGLTHIKITATRNDEAAEEEAEERRSRLPFRAFSVSCKSPHDYDYNDIMPLQETFLDGIKVWRPKNAMHILEQEYGQKALLSEKYYVSHRRETFGWDRTEKVWVPISGEDVEDQQESV
ncbi:hypothetical protein HDU79_005763 [Rhizoclosmatium sp. JEL0117]|nr:hypothetical protein HDU79_005763 [Rhizoclosmatium sp. JEL0117]